MAMCIARALDMYDPPSDTERYLKQTYSPSTLADLERRVEAAVSIATHTENGELLLAVPCAATAVSGPMLDPIFTHDTLHASIFVKTAAPPPVWTDASLDEWLGLLQKAAKATS